MATPCCLSKWLPGAERWLVHGIKLASCAPRASIRSDTRNSRPCFRSSHIWQKWDDGTGDAYTILGISKGASEREIKIAYLTKAKALHPDTNHDKGAHSQFIKLAAAFASISSKTSPDSWQGYKDVDGARARWYFENCSQELGNPAIVRELHAAADMESGGPDWGGMWEMARMMKAEEAVKDEEGEGGGRGGGRLGK